MNDAEKMFYNEVAERKRLARNARYKKNGSHSKKFGGVRYSQKDLERKNGEVVSYKMNVPHTIEELDAWPLDIQAEYYQSLTDSYFPQRLVCEMLGTSTRTLAKRLRACGVNWHGGNFKESRWLSAWNDFIIRGVAPEEVQEEVEGTLVNQPDVAATVKEAIDYINSEITSYLIDLSPKVNYIEVGAFSRNNLPEEMAYIYERNWYMVEHSDCGFLFMHFVGDFLASI